MFLYELLQTILSFVLRLVAALSGSGRVKRFALFKNNDFFKSQVEAARSHLQNLRNESPDAECIWVHVASAGELEQAVPVLRAISDQRQVVFFLTYFSPSAEPFIKNVPALIGAVGFPLDIKANHRFLISTLAIKKVFCVRYDIWPQMISQCRESGLDIVLLAATKRQAKGGLLASLAQRWKRGILKNFSHIFAVTENDVEFFRSIAPGAKVALAGDPKWTRARERAESLAKLGVVQKFGDFARFCFMQKSIGRSVFVFGSPHREETEVAVLTAKNPLAVIILVPQTLTPEEIARVSASFDVAQIPSLRVTELEVLMQEKASVDGNLPVSEVGSDDVSRIRTNSNESPLLAGRSDHARTAIDPEILNNRVVIFDKMGALAELYALADIAVVGGGFDGQIHNVLEPASHPVATVFGSLFRRSEEAATLVEKQAGLSFDSPHDMFQFLNQCVSLGDGNQTVLSCAQQLASLRLKAIELFGKTPNTNTVVLEALFRK